MRRGGAKQLVLKVSGEVRRFDLAPGGEAVVIGRAPDAQLKVEAALVSRRHCAIRLGERGLEVRDLGSLNGTYLNGLKVTTAPLSEGDVVKIGECEIAVGSDQESALTCRRCGRLASLATVEDGGEVRVAGEIVCASCNTGAHYTSPSVEKKLSDVLDADGFEILARVSPRTSSCPVFKARRRDLDDVVALKVLPILGEVPEKKLGRFKAEARVMAQLKHPNVVSVYDVRHRPTLSLLVMEFVAGETLLQRIERKKKLRPAEVLKHAISIASALEAAGKLGIAHRNVKPSNVIVSRATGEARLIDFGLARNLRAERPGLTDRMTPLGTIRYMAPEQMRDAHAADERSDIYSLAATLFHALTGKLPRHERNELDLLQAAVEGRSLPFDLSREEVPQELKNILACALMLDPRDRQPNATVLLEELRAAAARQPTFDDRDATTGPISVPPRETGVFSGDQLIELVRLLGVNGRSGQLEVKSGVRGGTLVFHDGRVI
ncbi:MAG: protein kinase, partial [Planctomycetota bacterium]